MALGEALGFLGVVMVIATILLIAAIVTAFVAAYGCNDDSGKECEDNCDSSTSKCRKWARYTAWILVAFLGVILVLKVALIAGTAAAIEGAIQNMVAYAGEVQKMISERLSQVGNVVQGTDLANDSTYRTTMQNLQRVGQDVTRAITPSLQEFRTAIR